MYATDGQAFQFVVMTLLADLCFIDEREDDLDSAGQALRVFGKRGISGAFVAVFGEDCSYLGEVASVLVEQACKLGYLTVSAPTFDLPDVVSVARSFEDTDRRVSEIVAELGPPTLAIDRRVLCYRCMGDEWVFFDCFEPRTSVYDPAKGGAQWEQAPDPLLRDVRIPESSFDAGLILTAYGKFLRWGHGWRLRPDASGGSFPPGVADQLRHIAAGDPSESLGPRRP